jgi:phospholipid/cholesterol/gamma-HCH transport system substrate-binding protein
VTDTVVFNRLKASVVQLQNAADNTAATVASLKAAAENPNSPMGVLMRDEASGAKIRSTISNLEAGSVTLNEDLKALQHSILLRRGIKKEEKAKEKAAEEQQAP